MICAFVVRVHEWHKTHFLMARLIYFKGMGNILCDQFKMKAYHPVEKSFSNL